MTIFPTTDLIPRATAIARPVRRRDSAIELGRPRSSPLGILGSLHDAGDVYALAIDGDTLYVGGTFDALAGVQREGLGAVSRATGQPTSWNPRDPSATVLQVSWVGTRLYVGGEFQRVGPLPAAGVAVFEP